jgi:hypothetical protein
MGNAADSAKPLARLDSFLSRGADPSDALFGSDSDGDPAVRLGFLLGSDSQDLLLGRTAPEDTRPQRDVADLLPMQQRILALVATLFSQRNTTPDDTREGNPPKRQSDSAGEAVESALPPRAQPALIDFVAGLRALPVPESLAELPPAPPPPAADSSDLPTAEGPSDGESAPESAASGEGESGPAAGGE